MKNFRRAIGYALKYRAMLVGSTACALLVAVLWGANIGSVYPFVQVVFQGQSLPQWIDNEIAQTETRLGEGRALATYRWAQPILHRSLPAQPFATLVLIVGVLLAGTLIKDVFLVGNVMLVERTAEMVKFDLRTDFYRHTLDMDMQSFAKDRSGALMSRFTHDMEALGQGVQVLFGRMLLEPLKMAACLIGAGFICWRLLVLSLIVSPLALFVIDRLSKSLKRANRRGMEEMSVLFRVLHETLAAIAAVKAFTMEGRERARFHDAARAYLKRAMRIVFYHGLARPATELMGMIVICLAILAGGYLVLNNETHLLGIRMCEQPLSIAAMMAFFALLIGASDPLRKLSECFNHLQRGAAAADRVFEMLDRSPAIRDPERPRELPSRHPDLVFENVSFHYSPEEPVLREVNLRIPFGESLAIVGPNGCGKSTLASLVPRFWDAVEGAVRIDDVDLRELRQRDLRGLIGLVTQQALLFDDTVLENIRYGSPEATEGEVFEAARKAHAHRFITETLEEGYRTIVGQGGARLSGGQRQRIALARAILRDPAILVLDEATSQIDLESEQLIHKALQRFIRGRTAIMITHRPSTLALADRIVVMDAGRIVDIGTYDELSVRCEPFRRLVSAPRQQSA
jgi:subfamily B ATP-binding cassette protein MsbA